MQSLSWIGFFMPSCLFGLFPRQVCAKGSFRSEQNICLPCNCKGHADYCEDITGICIVSIWFGAYLTKSEETLHVVVCFPLRTAGTTVQGISVKGVKMAMC